MADNCANCGAELTPYDGYPHVDCWCCGERNQVHCHECVHWENETSTACVTCEEGSNFIETGQ